MIYTSPPSGGFFLGGKKKRKMEPAGEEIYPLGLNIHNNLLPEGLQSVNWVEKKEKGA
jgi:hypothetical protein